MLRAVRIETRLGKLTVGWSGQDVGACLFKRRIYFLNSDKKRDKVKIKSIYIIKAAMSLTDIENRGKLERGEK